MTKLLPITVATVRHQLRWAAEHIYSLLILSPLVLGITYATFARLASNASDGWQPSLTISMLLAWLSVASVIALSMSRASGEIYHLRQPESFLDALPVASATHLHHALLTRIARTVLVGLVVLIARSLLNQGEAVIAPSLLPLGLFILITALTEMVAALNWIHWTSTRNKLTAICNSIMLLLGVSIAGLLLLMVVKPGLLSPRWLPPWLLAGGSLLAVALYLSARDAHQRWRVFDIEHAARLQTTNRWSIFRTSFTERWFSREVRVQLARDLQLTLRTFSSAVYVTVGIATLWLLALLAVLVTDVLPLATDAGNLLFDSGSSWANGTWLPPVVATKVVCVLAVASLAAQLPILVAYQLPYFWLERAAGTAGVKMWEAKMWYTRLVSVPAPFAAWLIGAVSGEVPLLYLLPLLAECLWLWWLVSSLIGVLSFEMPDQPGLAIIVMMTLGLGFGLLVALAWPLGFMLYAFGFRQMIERGHARARYYLATRGD